ncbi:AAA family ATPase, partial [Azospirillum brasilense]|nr:AAA family ATPase [Azospirillum brasilense]
MTDPVFPAALKNVHPLRGANVIAVASGKGGVGKTWFSITLAHALTKMGKNSLLFDGDLGLANVDIQLGFQPKNDLGAVINGDVTLGRAAQRYTEGGFDIIAGRSGSGTLAQLPSQRLSGLRNDLMELARRYDCVIMDMGAGVDRTVRTLSGPAGTTLVVTTDEPTSLTDAYAFIKLTHATNPTADLRVGVNRGRAVKAGGRPQGHTRKACPN